MRISRRSVAVALSLLALPAVVRAQATPLPAEIFARHVAAIGGHDAVMHVSSIKTQGTLVMASMGITANVESVAAAPNRSATRMTIPGIGEMASGFDGSVAWEVNPMQGPRIKTEKETATAQEESDFYGAMLFSSTRYQSTETVGQVDFAGEKAWQVKTVLKSGRVVNEYFSVASGLKIGSQARQESAQGTLDVVIIESGYKQFGDLKLPTRSEMITGPQKMVVTITNIIIGDVSPTAFALPDPVKALVKP
jgi:hypothetical protein